MTKLGFAFAAAAMTAAICSPALAQQHARDLVRENIANGIAFTAKYSGQSMSVDDYVIASSASPEGGHGSIAVGAKPDKFGFPPSAQALCVLANTKEIQTFGALSKGSHIVLIGKFSSMMGSTIMLTDCSFRMSTAK